MAPVAPYRVTRPRIGWSARPAAVTTGFTGCSSSPVQSSSDPGWGLHGSLAYVSVANLTEFRAQWCGSLGDGSGDLWLQRSLNDELVVGHNYEMVLDYTVISPVGGGGRMGMVVSPATSNFPNPGVGVQSQTIAFTYTGTPFVVKVGIGELGNLITYPVYRMTIQSLVLTDTTASAVVDLTPAIGTVPETDFIEFGFPLFNARAWCEPCAGSELVAYPGVEDGWLEQLSQYLQGDVPFVPATDSVTSFGPATGWDGATGWQRFLPLAQAGRPFYFWRDATDAGSKLLCVLEEPKGPPAPDLGLFRRFTLRLRTVAGERFSGY